MSLRMSRVMGMGSVMTMKRRKSVTKKRGSVTTMKKRRKRVKPATDETTVHAVVPSPDSDESSNHRA